IISALILLQVITLKSGDADLLATGERDSATYRLGYAISSIMTLKSREGTVYFDVIPSNEGDDGIRFLQDKVSDFALVNSAVAASAFDSEEIAEAMRGLIVVRRPQDQPLLLLTRADVAEQNVIDVTSAIFDHLDTLALLYESDAGIEVYTELDEHPFPIHPGAASYFSDVDQRPTVTTSKLGNDEDVLEMSSVISDLSEQLNLIKMERSALVEEVDFARNRQTSMMKKLESVEQQLETVIDEREGFSNELAAAKAQLNTIEFQELSQANEAAREMRLRAEQSEERYRRAVDVAQSCVEAQTGRRDNAFEALAQIERLESEVTACRAAQNNGGN
ncbi:MAG: TAXI family TRAP transporter solute-binding subunit, partial [Geminicoccaceae bacterium]